MLPDVSTLKYTPTDSSATPQTLSRVLDLEQLRWYSTSFPASHRLQEMNPLASTFLTSILHLKTGKRVCWRTADLNSSTSISQDLTSIASTFTTMESERSFPETKFITTQLTYKLLLRGNSSLPSRPVPAPPVRNQSPLPPG